MAYEVLARKYRSRTFDEIVGQTAIATTLRNAVESGRIHHGYLFTGTRGVGKTSMARILAKAVNCFAAERPTPTPCCQCESCLRIAEGEDLDVIEIDAASNTGVDNIRELRSNAAYRPARSRFKVYIIDEVHMLSPGAFNALLKTLEEPPEHVKFILATTESHKVPATIQSRCQRFDFRGITPIDIAGQLTRILKSEGIQADESVVRRIARLAGGSMRDALSILDQLLSAGGGTIDSSVVEDLLPGFYEEVIRDMFNAVAESDAATALDCANRCLAAGHSAERFCEMVIEHVRTLMLLAVCGSDTDLVDLTGAVREHLIEQAPKFDAPTYVHMIGLLEEVRRQVKTSGAPRPLLEAAVVRIALASEFTSITDLLTNLDDGSAKKNSEHQSKPPRHPPANRQDPAGPRRDRPVIAADGVNPVSPTPFTVRGDGKRGSDGSQSAPQVTSDERLQLHQRPLVKRALELTEGTIIDVRATNPTAGLDEGGGEAAEPVVEP